MKDLKEMFDALLAGDTLIHCGFELKVNNDGEIIGIDNFTMLIPDRWSIKPKHKQWYEKLNGREVLCKVWSVNFNEENIIPIASYNNQSIFKFKAKTGVNWKNSTPLTPEEIQVYLDNAKDIENDVF